MSLSIEIYSDVVCPWCFLGKRRLEAALASSRIESTVKYRPYELNPATPEEGVDHRAHLAAKFGGEKVLDAAHARLAALGKEAGIDYRFDLIRKTPNTFRAHRVLWLAEREGKAAETQEAFFRGYFTEGKDLGDGKVLADLAGKAGLPAARVEELLRGEEGAAEVREAEATAYDLGITGVPFFVLNGKFALEGAQPIDVFLKAIDQAAG